MLIKTTNHYMNASDILNALQLTGRNYIEIDNLRLVIEDGCIQGWYDPNGTRECCSARNRADKEQIVPSEGSVA